MFAGIKASIFNDTSGDCQPCLLQENQDIFNHVWWDKIGYFKWHIWTFLAFFVGTKSGIFNDMSGHFQMCLLGQIWLFFTTPWDVSSHVCCNNIGFFQHHVVTFPAVFVVTHLGISNKTSRHFEPSLLQQNKLFLTTPLDFSSHSCWDKSKYFFINTIGHF